ncbi:unnamed protein product [Brugia pahangi]|uniref:Uncharacterized protein n=1 Tax=Brugia pahangi TaxID=6280 RepID=A0A0N4T0F5_BRUPA|nr:unnamed protein product [Brugia pahangi]
MNSAFQMCQRSSETPCTSIPAFPKFVTKLLENGNNTNRLRKVVRDSCLCAYVHQYMYVGVCVCIRYTIGWWDVVLAKWCPQITELSCRVDYQGVKGTKEIEIVGDKQRLGEQAEIRWETAPASKYLHGKANLLHSSILIS